jgi:hypothetical protein
VPSAPDTTFGTSAAQITRPVSRRGPGLLIGGLVLLAGGATAAYFLTTPDAVKQPRDSAGSASTSPAVQAPIVPRPYRVLVTASPKTARLAIDGRERGTGRIDEEIASDGVEHTLTVTADGFTTARLRFRDEPPPEQVTLEPIAAAPAAAAAEPKHPVADAPRTRPTGRGHERSRERGAGAARPATPAGAAATPVRGANNAAIIE